MSDKFDYESAREHLWDAGLDPDDLPEKNPQRRDAYLQKNGINPDQFKPYGSRGQGDSGSGPSGGSGSGGCFLTTACVRVKNLPDDCEELEILRKFRDTFMMSTEQGRTDVEHYYAVAPIIVEEVNNLPDADEVWEKLYADVVVPAVELIKNDHFDDAFQLYENCVMQLEMRFVAVH